jgi:hypothetical protein
LNDGEASGVLNNSNLNFGEEGSCVSMAAFFFLTNIGLEHDLPLLLLPTLLLRNLINGGRNLLV